MEKITIGYKRCNEAGNVNINNYLIKCNDINNGSSTSFLSAGKKKKKHFRNEQKQKFHMTAFCEGKTFK